MSANEIRKYLNVINEDFKPAIKDPDTSGNFVGNDNFIMVNDIDDELGLRLQQILSSKRFDVSSVKYVPEYGLLSFKIQHDNTVANLEPVFAKLVPDYKNVIKWRVVDGDGSLVNGDSVY